MPLLKGSITSLIDYKLPTNSTVVFCIYDSSNKKQLATLLHRAEIQNPDSFPIQYELEYQEPEENLDSKLYHLSVTILQSDKTLYTNNSKDVIAKNIKLRKYLDVFLYPVTVSNSTKEA